MVRRLLDQFQRLGDGLCVQRTEDVIFMAKTGRLGGALEVEIEYLQQHGHAVLLTPGPIDTGAAGHAKRFGNLIPCDHWSPAWRGSKHTQS